MDKTEVQRWRRTVIRVIQSLDERWETTDPTFSAAMVLAAIDGFGTDVTVLSELTGFSIPYVSQVLKRLRRARLVVGQTVRVGWDDKKTGNVAFIADALTAAGLVTRKPDPKRSAAMKARPATQKPRARRARVNIPTGTVFTPQRVKSDPFYISTHIGKVQAQKGSFE